MVGGEAPTQQPAQGNVLDAMDPCGAHVQELCGPLLMYYALNHRGPARLEELQSLADPGENLSFTCPVSGQRYLCAPQGLEAAGQSYRIFVYDAQPVHHGSRWCAVKKITIVPGEAEVMYALNIPEEKFRQFKQVAAAPQ